MARRTLEGLRTLGVDARMLVSGPLPEDAPEYVQSVEGAKWQLLRYLEKLGTFFQVHFQRKYLFRYSSATCGLSRTLLSHPWVKWADTISIHWVQQSFLSLDDLKELTAMEGKKILWTLHDLWPITGGCHSPYFMDRDGKTHKCERFTNGCGMCPLLSGRFSRLYDPSFRQLRDKKKNLRGGITFLAVSRSVEAALKKTLLSGEEYVFVPNFYDPHVFSPSSTPSQNESHQLLFVAATPDDPVKGADLLMEALRKTVAIRPEFAHDYTLTIVGSPKSPDLFHDPGIPLRFIPTATEDQLCELYRTSRVTLSTSRMETFGLTLLESIACGTPVVTFDIDQPTTFRIEGVNSSSVTPYDTDAYASALLKWCYPEDNVTRLTPTDIAETVSSFRSSVVLKELLPLLK